jgi:hypothetical protein
MDEGARLVRRNPCASISTGSVLGDGQDGQVSCDRTGQQAGSDLDSRGAGWTRGRASGTCCSPREPAGAVATSRPHLWV